MNKLALMQIIAATTAATTNAHKIDSTRVKSQKELRTPEQSEYLIKKAEEKRARRAKR